MTEILETAQDTIREAAEATELPAFQRLGRLKGYRHELELALEEADAAIMVAEAEVEDDPLSVGLAIQALRERATIGDRLVAAGSATPEELSEAGVLTHTDLDAMDEEGLLESAAHELVTSPAYVAFDPDAFESEPEPDVF